MELKAQKSTKVELNEDELETIRTALGLLTDQIKYTRRSIIDIYKNKANTNSMGDYMLYVSGIEKKIRDILEEMDNEGL